MYFQNILVNDHPLVPESISPSSKVSVLDNQGCPVNTNDPDILGGIISSKVLSTMNDKLGDL